MALIEWRGVQCPFPVSQVFDFVLGHSEHSEFDPVSFTQPSRMPNTVKVFAIRSTVPAVMQIPPGFHVPGNSQNPPFSLNLIANETFWTANIDAAAADIRSVFKTQTWLGKLTVSNDGEDGELSYMLWTTG